MANFKNIRWTGTHGINSHEYVCWNCGKLVASQTGYYTTQSEYGKFSYIHICPHCNAPKIKDLDNLELPYRIPNKDFTKLPEEVKKVYDEACVCLGAGAYTAAVMLFRKILMNLAVEEGADEGKTFAYYVKHLCDESVIHKKQHAKADEIRTLGNDATHKIESRTKEDAEKLFDLVTLILTYNYEHADE